MFRYKIIHGFFFLQFGNLSPSGQQIGNDATPGEKTQFISYMLLKKEWIDVLPQALWLTRGRHRHRYGLFKQEVLHTEMFPWDTASVFSSQAAAVNSGLPLRVSIFSLSALIQNYCFSFPSTRMQPPQTQLCLQKITVVLSQSHYLYF